MTLLGGDLVEEVRALKSKHDEVQVHGSATLLRSLIADDLVDVYRVLTFPVLTGPGKRLFGEGAPPGAMTLESTSTSSTGVIASIYRRAGGLVQAEAPPPV
ncbi:MAG TPA: dihydrofolate reductase family protein [Sandaracinaceae bacterium LLY-WYZ-13_1]|nr:dihydrofolate reductase family protein [Sandaracinaceae bacterium LLY-WYZ-13_1]